jgi:hypothetical protein
MSDFDQRRESYHEMQKGDSEQTATLKVNALERFIPTAGIKWGGVLAIALLPRFANSARSDSDFM